MFRTITVALALVLAAPAAMASTINVHETSCSGQPTPCTTDLQAALDDPRFDTVNILANQHMEGEFLIDRSVTLQGNTGSRLERETGETYALHIDDATTVTVTGLDILGRLAVNESSGVTLDDLHIDGGALAIHILDSDDVLIRACHLEADRGVENQESTNVELDDAEVTANDYAVVASGGDIDVHGGELHGDDNTFVLQDGPGSGTSDLTATDATLTANAGNDTTWRWNRTTSSYTNCTPTPSEDVDTSANLVSLTGYTPWGGN